MVVSGSFLDLDAFAAKKPYTFKDVFAYYYGWESPN